METKDAIVSLYGDVIDTNRSLKELARICSRSVRAQNKINRRLCVNIFATAVSVTLAWMYIHEQNKKIDKISKEIKELKSEKGE